ncbi:MAG: dihydropteroate synthase [Proteobacteria bacterium]|nr:MAG: dihydropteroate synthase [Pseudomonadota bacterium]
MSLVIPPLQLDGTRWDYQRTLIFGVLNVTPDSFSDGGRFIDLEAAIARGEALVAAGADALDTGGESTRPRSTPVDALEEKRRVLPVLEALSERVSVPLSVDTYKAEVARDAVSAGASIINDVSGGTLDEAMYSVAAETGALYIAGHLRGEPATMMDEVHFDDVVAEVEDELRQRLRRAVVAGLPPEKLWIDPGVGFGKGEDHSLTLIAATGRLREALGHPIMIGPSRKSFIGQLTGKGTAERVMGTAGAASVAIARGADALRLHDVAELHDAVVVADAIARAKVRAAGDPRTSAPRG